MTFTFYNLGGGGAAAETVDVTAGETLAAGEVALISVGYPGTAGQAYLADASDPRLSSSGAVIGVVETGGAASATVTIQLTGTATVAGLTGGKFYGVSAAAPGALALSASSPTIGYASSATELKLTGLVSGLSSLVVGASYASDGAGALSGSATNVVGVALSTTELLITPRAASRSMLALGDIAYLMGGKPGGSTTGSTDVDSHVMTTLVGTADVGTLAAARYALGGAGNTTRVIAMGGTRSATSYNTIQYSDNGVGFYNDFGDLTAATPIYTGGCSNQTIGLCAVSNNMDKITISTTGNAANIGNLTNPASSPAAVASPTRASFVGGANGATEYDTIDTTLFASATTAVDSGDLTAARQALTSAGSATRAITFGGYSGGSLLMMDYWAIAGSGITAADFGDLNTAVALNTAASNATRAASFGGWSSVGSVFRSSIQYVTIASTANATTSGETLAATGSDFGAHSTGNGGLQ